MDLKPPAIEIPEDDPFKNDLLELRKEEAVYLTQLVSSTQQPLVLAIDSPWGSGKTTFIKMWIAQLKNGGFPCLFFNAWENDFIDDPLIAFIGEIDAGIKSFGLKGNWRKHWNQAKTLGKKLAKKSVPLGVKLITLNTIDVEKEAKEVFAEIGEEVSKDILKKYDKERTDRQKFKERLSEFISSLQEADSPNPKPLLFFIDELDRCRPTFSIQLLERIKHFFDIPGILFVLALDKEQLHHSVKMVYGTNMNVEGYLRRFIDLDYSLRKPSTEKYPTFLYYKLGLNTLIEEKEISPERLDEVRELIGSLTELCRLDLRELEHFFSRLKLIIWTWGKEIAWFHMLTAYLTIKIKDESLYRKLLRADQPSELASNYFSELSKGKILDNEIDEKFIQLQSILMADGLTFDELREIISEKDLFLEKNKADWENPNYGRTQIQSRTLRDLASKYFKSVPMVPGVNFSEVRVDISKKILKAIELTKQFKM